MWRDVQGPRLDEKPLRLINRGASARTAQFGAAALGVVLLAGSFLGGAAGHAGLAHGSSQAWVEDGPRGELVEIDTASGQAQQRLEVAAKGDVLDVHQRAQNLVVQDRTTGTLRTIDLTTLLAEGERSVRPGADTEVILDGPRVALAQLSTGTIQGIDPVSSASVGAPYVVGAPLSAAVADGSGHVWGLATTGRLEELAWAGSGYTLRDSIAVRGAGPGSGLSAHTSGVTVLVTPTGSVQDAGDNAAGTTDVRTATQLGSPVLVTPSTPPGVVPAASRGNSVVVIATPTGVVQPDLAPAGCAHPLTPVVFDNRIYVPCDGSPEVVVLNADGSSAGPPITVPSGQPPELTVAGGTLVVNVPGASSVVLVSPKGGTSTVGTEPAGIPTTSQSDPAPMPSPSTPPPSSHPKASASSSLPPKGADAAQVSVSISPSRPANGSIAIGVDWSVAHEGSGDTFLVTVAVNGGASQTLQVPNSRTRSASVTVSCPGSCSGTAGVAVVGGSGPGSSDTAPWTSVVSTSRGGSSPGKSPRPPEAAGKQSASPGTPVIGPSASLLPPPGPALPVPVATLTPTPGAATTSRGPDSPAPTASATVTRGPTADPIRPTLAPEPTTAAPAPTSAAPAPAPTTAPPTTAPPTTAPAAPPAPAAPAAGETVISSGHAALRGASVTLTITEPADWAASGASCSVQNAGDDGATGSFTCNSTTAFTERETTGPEDYEDYYVQAVMPGGATVDSAHFTINTPSSCTGSSCACNSSFSATRAGQASAYAVEPAQPATTDGIEPDQIAPCP